MKKLILLLTLAGIGYLAGVPAAYAQTDTTVFTIVEVQPEFPGGIEALKRYLKQNVKYPEAAAKAKVQGRVFLEFVITTEGKIRDIRVLKGIGHGANEEAVRVVSQMPDWTPGKQSGRPMNVKYHLPVHFQL
ncbi:energy transducer TonB [Telluribacter sp.]|jgi:protein TonB|uniref:energy transducer TonB n=1 Tax=Telluribacter sp. TaxID=1978767 RepID=UPI002E125F8D|nr:energy transducer TonB [Telluribacter sp.]